MRYTQRFYLFLVLAWILPFFGTHTDSNIFRHSSGQFFDTRRIYLFPVLIEILPLFGTRLDNFSILAQILPFPSTGPDSTIFRYSHRFDLFPVLAGTVFRYSQEFYIFPIVARILPFFGTHTDLTLFRYSPEQLFDTRRNSTSSPYSPRF